MGQIIWSYTEKIIKYPFFYQFRMPLKAVVVLVPFDDFGHYGHVDTVS